MAKQAPRRLVDLGRLAVLVAIVFLIRDAHEEFLTKQPTQLQSLGLDQAKPFFEEARFTKGLENGVLKIFDADEKLLGYLVQTSPASDASIGFSGSTNVMLVFDHEHKLFDLEILSSGDTKEHLDAVLADRSFLKDFKGHTEEELGEGIEVEGVSGATLTSMAIVEGIARRCSNLQLSDHPSRITSTKISKDKIARQQRSFRFPNSITLAEAQTRWPSCQSLLPSKTNPHLLDALDANGSLLGHLARTAPAADDVIGYQGPTDSLLAFDRNKTLTTLSIRSSFDNQPYVGYLPQEYSFIASFEGRSLDQLADMNLTAEGVEGVSGATMTSMAVAEGIVNTAQAFRSSDHNVTDQSTIDDGNVTGQLMADDGNVSKRDSKTETKLVFRLRDIGSLIVIIFAFLLAFSRLRKSKRARRVLQVALILYLGFVNGDILSQALLVGWAQSGAPWHLAPSLVLLGLAALIVPITTRKQFYCHNLCPHGAAQELLQKTIGRKVSLPAKVTRLLEVIPILLLALVVVTAIGHFSFSLVNLEPFDAYLFRIAGWITLTIAVVGLVASAFVPMAYCRFGCPTGAMLNLLIPGTSQGGLNKRDYSALLLLGLALTCRWGL